MDKQSLVVTDTLSEAFSKFKEHWRLLLGAGFTVHLVFLAYFLTGVGLLHLFAPLVLLGRGEPTLGVMLFLVVFALGGLALSTLLHMGFQGICLDLQRGRTPTVWSLFAQRRALGRGIAASFLLSLLTSVVIAAIWRLPVAGEVAVSAAAGLSAVFVSFAYFFIIDRNRAALNAIEASFRTVWGGGLPVVGLFLCCLGITGLAALIPFVGTIVGWSITSLAYSAAYVRLAP